MADRKPISKRLRFEVFKRDNFTCQYCGAKAPDAVLHIDHIHPVVDGGTNDVTNLITACSDCNLGKGAALLSENAEMDKKSKQLEELKENRDKLAALYELEMELSSIKYDDLTVACDLFENLMDCNITDIGKKDMRSWIRKFGLEQVMDAIRISASSYSEASMAFNKVPGICWNRTHKSCHQCIHAENTSRKWIIRCKWRTHPVYNSDDEVIDYEEIEYKTTAAKCCPDYTSRWS